MRKNKIVIKFALVSIVIILASCSSIPVGEPAPLGQSSFEEYRLETINWIEENREFVNENHEQEIIWNAPQEWKPKVQTGKGILLIHGLTSSPYDFIDIAPALAENGFLVRTVLLPGHGTKPEDLINITTQQWLKIIEEQAKILSADVDELYIGGFSAGGSLALEYAMRHPDVKGLVLFAPALKLDPNLDSFTPFLSSFKTWLLSPKKVPKPSEVRYFNAPANAFAVHYRIRSSILSQLEKQNYEKPVIIIQAQADSAVKSKYVLEIFESKITNPESRLLWYGELPKSYTANERIIVFPDYLPEWKIAQFSHMGILYSPENKEYGPGGTLQICWNGQSKDNYNLCLSGADVWYSDYGYKEKGKIFARLTFNPYFEKQMQIIIKALNKTNE